MVQSKSSLHSPSPPSNGPRAERSGDARDSAYSSGCTASSHESDDTRAACNKAEKFATYSADLKEEVEEQFEKIFTFHLCGTSSRPLPHPSRVFVDSHRGSLPPVWEELMVLKEELNDLKSHLNDKEITSWRKHTQANHLAGDVVQHLKTTVSPDLCTQAWTKFHEILFLFDIVPKDCNRKFLSAHLCEAPGAFVSSLNHFLSTHRKDVNWLWFATTLNPYYEGNDLDIMIADDRILSLTLPNWFFGADDTGDIMNLNNMFALARFIDHEVDLVTADGSVNCQDKPDEQESLVVALHYCEIVSALHILAPGGSFVLKVFTFFEHPSVCMLYLLNAVFSEVNVFKPATSKPGNSELYIVCTGYCGRSNISDYMEVLCKNFSPSVFDTKNMFFVEDIPRSFIEEVQDCAHMFTTLQSETIRRNIAMFEHPSPEDAFRYQQGRELCTFMWTDKMDVKYIRDSCRLHPSLKFKPSGISPYAFTMKQHGNFYERLEQSGLAWRQRVELEKPENLLKRILPRYSRGTAEWLQDSRSAGFALDYKLWRPVFGRKLTVVKNSRYCLPQLLKELNDALLNCQFLRNPDLLREFKSEFLVGSKDVAYKESLNLIQKEVFPRLNEAKSISCILLRGKLIYDAVNELLGGATRKLFILEYRSGKTHLDEVSLGSKRETGAGDAGEVVTAVDDDFNLGQVSEPSARMQAISAVQSAGAHLVMMDISSDVFSVGNFAEMYTKSEFLTGVMLGLKSLRTGGYLLLGIDEMLTRFDVCIFYILLKLFKKVTILQVSRAITCSGRLLVCSNFQGVAEGLMKFLAVIGEHLHRNRTKPNEDVLQFVDHTLITESIITAFLNEKNNAHLYRLLSCMIEFEKRKFPLKICTVNAKQAAAAPIKNAAAAAAASIEVKQI